MPYKIEKKMLRVNASDLAEFQRWQEAVNDRLTLAPLSQSEFFGLIVDNFGNVIRKWVGLE